MDNKNKLPIPRVAGQDAQERVAKTYIRWHFAQNIIHTLCGSAIVALILLKAC